MAAPNLAPVARPGQTDPQPLLTVIRRWWLLHLSGAITAVGLTTALLAIATPGFETTHTILVDQPAAASTFDVPPIAVLLPSYARLVTSDEVLGEAGADAGLDLDIDELRARVGARVVPDQVVLQVTASDPDDAARADRLAASVVESFERRLEALQVDADIPEAQRFVTSTLQSPAAERPERGVLRTIVLAGLFGFAVMVGVSLFIENARRQ